MGAMATVWTVGAFQILKRRNIAFNLFIVENLKLGDTPGSSISDVPMMRVKIPPFHHGSFQLIDVFIISSLQATRNFEHGER
jgi:hypothetical protein